MRFRVSVLAYVDIYFYQKLEIPIPTWLWSFTVQTSEGHGHGCFQGGLQNSALLALACGRSFPPSFAPPDCRGCSGVRPTSSACVFVRACVHARVCVCAVCAWVFVLCVYGFCLEVPLHCLRAYLYVQIMCVLSFCVDCLCICCVCNEKSVFNV